MIKNGTILVRNKTRERLKLVGVKGQTYDDVINQLIDIKAKNANRNLLDPRFDTKHISNSVNS